MRSAAFENEAVVCSGGWGGVTGACGSRLNPGFVGARVGEHLWRYLPLLAIDRKPGLLGNKSHLGQSVSIFPEKCYYLTARSL